MSPDEFARLQIALLENATEQNRLLKKIGDGVVFLAWAIIIALAIILSMSLKW